MSKQKIYPFAVAAVRCMENNLIKKDKLMQMAEAPTAEDVLHMLARKKVFRFAGNKGRCGKRCT